MTTETKRLTTPIIAGFLIGGVAVLAFFLHAAHLYSKTPSDPQKAIGYFSIAVYSGFVGAAAFGSAFIGSVIPFFRQSKAKTLGLAVLSLSLALTTVLLVILSPK